MKLFGGISTGLAKRVVTLDIDEAAIRVLQVKGKNVEKWATIPLEAGKRESGSALNSELLASKIRELFRTEGIKRKNVIVGVSSLYTTTRIVTVPYQSRGGLSQETVANAVKNLMPLDVNDLYLSWQSLGNKEEGYQVIVTGVPKDIMDSEMRALKGAGITPNLVELRPMAVARLVGREEAIIVNPEQGSYDIVIVIGGVPEIIFTSLWQPASLSTGDIARTLAEAFGRALAFYGAQYPDKHLSAGIPTFLTGALAGDIELKTRLEERLGTKVESLESPFAHGDSLPVSQYAANLGLALKEISLQKNRKNHTATKPDINYLPDAYRSWRLTSRVLLFLAAILVALAGAVFMVQLTTATMSKTADLAMRQQLLNAELQRRQVEIKNRLPLQRMIDTFHTIGNMDGNFAPSIRLVFEEAKKNNVEISSLTDEGKSITVNCKGEDDESFGKFLSALSASGKFSSVSPPPEGYPYTTGGTVRITLKAGK